MKGFPFELIDFSSRKAQRTKNSSYLSKKRVGSLISMLLTAPGLMEMLGKSSGSALVDLMLDD